MEAHSLTKNFYNQSIRPRGSDFIFPFPRELNSNFPWRKVLKLVIRYSIKLHLMIEAKSLLERTRELSNKCFFVRNSHSPSAKAVMFLCNSSTMIFLDFLSTSLKLLIFLSRPYRRIACHVA